MKNNRCNTVMVKNVLTGKKEEWKIIPIKERKYNEHIHNMQNMQKTNR